MFKSSFFILSFLLLTATISYSTPGDLDPAFGENGVAIYNGAANDDHGFAVAIQSDGKIVVAGGTSASLYFDVLVLRYNNNGPLDNFFRIIPPLVRHVEGKKTSLMKELTLNGRRKSVEICQPVPQEVKETPVETENFLFENGPEWIAEGNYNRVLDKIKDLPEKSKNNAQIRTLEYFANLKGWVVKKDVGCKTKWWALRTELIKLGDNEATPMLVIFLKDKDPYLRLYAAELLSHIGDKRALKDLREAGENDGNSQVRKNARWAYEQISGKKF